jgi:hypothetical protein
MGRLASAECFSFFKNATNTGESNIFGNTRYADGTIEVSGTATAFTLKIEACVDYNGAVPTWTTLASIKADDLSTVTSIITTGIYDFSCVGKLIRIDLTSVTGGYVTVFGRFVG